MIGIGQKVYCAIDGGRNGVVTAIHGSTRVKTFPTFGFRYTEPNAYVTYDIVFMDGSEARNVPVPALTGNQWRILPGVARADEIESVLACAAAKRAEEAERIKKDAAELATEVEDIRSDPQFRHLRQASGCALGCASRHAQPPRRTQARLPRRGILRGDRKPRFAQRSLGRWPHCRSRHRHHREASGPHPMDVRLRIRRGDICLPRGFVRRRS